MDEAAALAAIGASAEQAEQDANTLRGPSGEYHPQAQPAGSGEELEGFFGRTFEIKRKA